MSFADTFFAFFNGMVAGMFFLYSGWSQVFVMQPFEIIKVRLQTQSAANKMYNGIADCLMKIIKNEGFLALYKGISEINWRKRHSFNRRRYSGIDEIRPLWELQEDNGQIERFKDKRIDNRPQVPLRILRRLHQLPPRRNASLNLRPPFNTRVSESKSNALRPRRSIPVHWTPSSRSSKSTALRDWIGVRQPPLLDNRLDWRCISPLLRR